MRVSSTRASVLPMLSTNSTFPFGAAGRHHAVAVCWARPGIGPATLGFDQGSIASPQPAPESGPCIDAGDLLVLPGIVDIHGDAFERAVMPRPGVSFPYAGALLDVDRQLLSHGITTEFHGVTLVLGRRPARRSLRAAHVRCSGAPATGAGRLPQGAPALRGLSPRRCGDRAVLDGRWPRRPARHQRSPADDGAQDGQRQQAGPVCRTRRVRPRDLP